MDIWEFGGSLALIFCLMGASWALAEYVDEIFKKRNKKKGENES